MWTPIAFISSTAHDLKPYREKARDACIQAGFQPRMMEHFTASGAHPPLAECLRQVSGSPTDAPCDILLAIVAHRYGWVPPGQPGDVQKSVTWLECEEATRCGMEVLAFQVNDNFAWPDELKEEYRLVEAVRHGKPIGPLTQQVEQNFKRLKQFKAWLDTHGVRADFTSPDSLGSAVLAALHGWRGRHSDGGRVRQQGGTAKPSKRWFVVHTNYEQPVLPRQEEAKCRFQTDLFIHTGQGKKPDFPCHLCLVLDLSGSMSRDSKYTLLQESLRRVLEHGTERMVISVVAFSRGAKQITYATPCRQIDPKVLLRQLEQSPVKFGNRTELAAGLGIGEELCRRFTATEPNSITRLYLMTDGRVHDPVACRAFSSRFADQGIEVHAFGLGPDSDLAVLRKVTAGCAGGKVKAYRQIPEIVSAFRRATTKTGSVFATDTEIQFRAAPRVFCNQAFLFRPRELDVSDFISADSASWSYPGWANFEPKRIYSFLFEVRLPVGSQERTLIGHLIVKSKIGGVEVREETAVTVARDESPQACSRFNRQVNKAFVSAEFRNSQDPEMLLKSLHARRDLYLAEGKPEATIKEVQASIDYLENRDSGSADDEFLLTPLEELGDVESGSQVIALDSELDVAMSAMPALLDEEGEGFVVSPPSIAETEEAVVALALEQPPWSHVRASDELEKRGHSITPGGVLTIWRQQGLETCKKRLKILEKKVAQGEITLSPDQRAALDEARQE